MPSCLALHTIPPDDPAVYDMICNADTIGVFQIESRAQMSMLPRLRPRCFYDLVIEVAIVRPGPIQGNMVHPYLRRRSGEEAVSYPSEALRNVLQKTLGVPLFQEQAMKVAMVGAGFSADEADQLRRAMAAWRRSSAIQSFHQKIIDGMIRNGYQREFAEQTFQQIQGFGEYGFPESHSASFALLVYVSAWIKCHHPAVFCCALLNSQPMGFYMPAQIVRDAREHGVEVRAVDVNESEWDCVLEEGREGKGTEGKGREGKGTEARRHEGTEGKTESFLPPACLPPSCLRAFVPSCLLPSSLRLGFRQIKGLSAAHIERLVRARREHGRFQSIDEFHRRTGLPRSVLEKLAEADAFASMGISRRQASWQVMGVSDERFPLFEDLDSTNNDPPPALPPMPAGQEVMTDYATAGLSLKQHPMSLVRDVLRSQKILTARDIATLPHGRWVKVAGLVLIRQRPGTASGIVFETLEDETGIVNLIVRPDIYDRYRAAARHAALLQCDGYLERHGQVTHVMAKRLFDRSELISGYTLSSRDFH